MRESGHPILLVVDAEGIETSRPRRGADRWYDLEWANILTQAYGGCDIADASDAPGFLAGRQLVVLPRRTAANASEELLRTLHERVGQGLAVMVEAPDSSLCRTFGLELAAVERRPLLPWPEPLGSSAARKLDLRPKPVPVPWTRLRYAPRPGATGGRPHVHLSLDGRPMGWSREHGEGAWLLLAVDFAELSARLRQGEEDSLPLDGQDHAWLDAWIEGICGAAMTELPLPRVAPAPPGADGWLIARTPEDSLARPTAESTLGWVSGTGAPARAMGRTGQLRSAWQLPAAYSGPTAGLERARVERWARLNASAAGGPLALAFSDPVEDDLARELSLVAELRGLTESDAGTLLAWWHARQDLRVFVERGPETVDYRIEALPEATHAFGLLVPVRWRDRSLEGWDADWGFARGRRVQRFDRNYRIIELGPGAEGGRLSLRYR